MTASGSQHPSELGVVAIGGSDASEFLRAQLTNDVMRLGPDRHFLAGWCDAKGRTLMIARVVENSDDYWLIMPRLLIEPVLRRLRMFVLRARVELADVTTQYRIGGLLARANVPPNRTERVNETVVLGLPGDDTSTSRALVVAPADMPLPDDACTIHGDAWQLAEVDAGMPAIYPPTQGLFVPQMLNLHWLMGIDFDKGCYPGQEVIARLHYRGRLTRRIYRLAWSGRMPAPGDDVIDANRTRQGTIVRAAHASEDEGRLLAVLKDAALGHPLATGNARLDLLELPYATPA